MGHVTTAERRFLGKCKRCKMPMRLDLSVEVTRSELRRFGVGGLELSPKVARYYVVHLPEGRTLRATDCVPSFGRSCACGSTVFVQPVVGRMNETVRCDARCTSATGHKCECSCGGKNHGSGH